MRIHKFPGGAYLSPRMYKSFISGSKYLETRLLWRLTWAQQRALVKRLAGCKGPALISDQERRDMGLPEPGCPENVVPGRMLQKHSPRSARVQKPRRQAPAAAAVALRQQVSTPNAWFKDQVRKGLTHATLHVALKKFREEHELQVAAFSRILNIPDCTYCNYEKGLYFPSLERYRRICEVISNPEKYVPMPATLLAENLRITRQRMKMTQQRFAELCQVSTATISAFEQGKNLPREDTCRRISDMLRQLNGAPEQKEVA